MKNLFAACTLLLIMLIVLFSCKQKSQELQFDDQGIILIDSVTIQPHDSYYQGQQKPTRGTAATVEIVNNNDTAKTFVVKILEVN